MRYKTARVSGPCALRGRCGETGAGVVADTSARCHVWPKLAKPHLIFFFSTPEPNWTDRKREQRTRRGKGEIHAAAPFLPLSWSSSTLQIASARDHGVPGSWLQVCRGPNLGEDRVHDVSSHSSPFLFCDLQFSFSFYSFLGTSDPRDPNFARVSELYLADKYTTYGIGFLFVWTGWFCFV